MKTLYHDFCVLLPDDGHEPLLQLPLVSVQFAQQLALSFTSLYPFHTGKYHCVHYVCTMTFIVSRLFWLCIQAQLIVVL